MKKYFSRFAIAAALVTLPVLSALSQCTLPNNAFQGGEVLQYDLYYKYGLIYTKAGSASLKTTSTTYKGQSAYKMNMLARSTGIVGAAFSVNDTLNAYINTGLAPLYFEKFAHENDDYNVEKISYNYVNNAVKISTIRHKNGNQRHNLTLDSNQCTYDFVSVVALARVLNYGSMSNGAKTRIRFISGKEQQNMDIVFQGTENMKASDGNTYNCYKLSLVTSDNAFQNKKEAMKIYLSADPNRIPVRIDSALKVGTMRIILKSFKGLKN